MDGRGEKPDNVRTGFEALELGGLDPVAREMRVVVDGKAIRINDVFKPWFSRMQLYYLASVRFEYSPARSRVFPS